MIGPTVSLSLTMLVLLAISTLMVQSASQEYVMTKVFDPSGEARCLDGTPPALYFKKGKSKDKFIIYFEGGAWCGGATLMETIKDCYARSLTDLGSSRNYPERMSQRGILSGDQKLNPYFYDFNVVYFKYCDGTGHQGYRAEPIIYNSIQLWFRGQKNVELLFQYAMNVLGLSQAKEVAVMGSSAGALASFYWVDALASKFSQSTTTVYGIPDSGIFLDVVNYQTGQYSYRIMIQNFMNIANRQTPPIISQCAVDNPDQQWKCLMAQYIFKYIKSPLFIIISEYDEYSIPQILGVNCLSKSTLKKCSSDERAKIEMYREKTMDTAEEYNIYAHASGWVPACINHCYMTFDTFTSTQYTIPMYTLNTLSTVIHRWRTGTNKLYMDDSKWPSNVPCSNI